jgi:Clp amino terminal domain, pathogenicity island component
MPPLNVNLQELIEQIDADVVDGDELDKVTEARQRANLLSGAGDQLIDHFVTRARAAGSSWSQIGGALGVSKQAAQQRWMSSPTFSRFTPRARHAVVTGQDIARELRHPAVGPEHVILGLLHVEEGVAAQVMVETAGSAEAIRKRVVPAMPAMTNPSSAAHLPFGPEAKEAMKQALEQALELGHNYIGTEHLLLGLLRVPDGRGAELLAELGITYDAARAGVLAVFERLTAQRAAKPQAE